MNRKTWFGLVPVGLIAWMFAGGFVGCYDTRVNDKGVCEDDGNPCTVDTCDANGTPIHTPVSAVVMTGCFLGENEGICRSGSCELNCVTSMTPCKCSTKSDCPTDTLCATWTCTAGECVSTAMMEGMTADPLQPGDCQKRVCQGGSLKVVDDPMDTPTDVKGDCQDPVCNAGVPGTMANDNDVPMNDVNGDCMKPTCSGGVPGTTPDTQDIPVATACQVFACNADGTPQAANAAVGTTCGAMMTMACDKTGGCVGCLPKPDWDKCKAQNIPQPCPVKLCLGEWADNASDCQSGFIADKVCCDTTCTGECKSCVVAGMEGKCTNIPYYQTDPAYIDQFMAPTKCETASRCNGTGKCLRIVNKGCADDTECISGKCAMPPMLCLGAKGEACSSGTQCVSGVCNALGSCD